MDAISLYLLGQMHARCPSAAAVPFERVRATAHVESGRRATSIHDNTTSQSYAPATTVEAARLALALRAQGHSVDAGVMQVNSLNWQWLGLTAETVFDPQTNVCAAMAKLAVDYAIERRVSCRYNTGRPECDNGYPERIASAWQQDSTLAIPVQPTAVAVQPDPDAPDPGDIWAWQEYQERRAIKQAAPDADDAPAGMPTPALPAPKPTGQNEAGPVVLRSLEVSAE